MRLNPPQSHRRSRRLRKKRRIDEFKELGFTIAITLAEESSSDDVSVLLGAMISEVLEARNLQFGGVLQGGYIVSTHRGSATDTDRDALRDWWQSRVEVTSVNIGALEDAWHDQRHNF